MLRVQTNRRQVETKLYHILSRKECKKMCYSKKMGASIYSAVPYSFPKFHDGKTPYVDFVCYDPVIGKMRRKKFHISGIKSKSARKQRAAEIIALISARLREGWNVWAEEVGSREYTLLSEILSSKSV